MTAARRRFWMTALRWLVACIALAITGAPASTARAMEATSAVVWVAERATSTPRVERDEHDEADQTRAPTPIRAGLSPLDHAELHARAPARLAPPADEDRYLLNCALLC